MAVYGVFQRNIADSKGNIQAQASIEIRRESDNGIAPIYQDRAGNTPLTNPVNADDDGFIRFYAPLDRYRVTATKGPFQVTWRDVEVGGVMNFSDLDVLPITSLDRLVDKMLIQDASAGVPKSFYIPQNILDITNPAFGVTGDGTDESILILAAGVIAAARGAMLWFPGGKDYGIGSEIEPPTGSHWVAENRYTTVLRALTADGTILLISNPFVRIEGFQFSTDVTRTGGWYIIVDADNFEFYHFYLNAGFGGLQILSGSVLAFSNGDIVNTENGGTSLHVDGGFAVSFKKLVCSGGTIPERHLLVTNCGDVTFDESCQFLLAKNNMEIRLETGAVVVSLKFYGWLDQATEINVKLIMNGGFFGRASFINGWMAQGGIANFTCNGSSGTIDGIDFTNFDNYSSGYLLAFDANSGVVKNIQVVGGKLGEGNAETILANNVKGLTIVGTKGGEVSGWSTSSVFLTLGGDTDHVDVSHNDMRGATTKVVNGASGTDISIKDNIGHQEIITPAQMTGNTDNYAPTGIHGAEVLQISSSGAIDLTGIVAPGRSKYMLILNIGGFTITLKAETTSTAANRFFFSTGDLALLSGQAIMVFYSTTSQRWFKTS